MGLFKKDKDGAEDSNRSALFSRSKNKSPAPPSQNPYANAPPTDPYAQAKAKTYSGPPPGAGGGLPSGPGAGRSGGGLPSGPAAGRQGGGYGAQGGYGGGAGGGYPNEKSASVTGPGQAYGGRGGGYGASGGYGGGGYGGSNPYGGGAHGGGAPSDNRYGGSDNRYGSGAPAQSSSTGMRPGGYGGMGGADDDDTRGALFSGAKERVAQKQQAPGGDRPPAYDQEGQGGYGGAQGGYGDDSQGFGSRPTYDDRQLTAEEEEEQDVNATKQQMRFMKQEDVSSTRNALRIAQQAEETGRDTLARLGAQGEQMHNTKKNLDLAHNQNRIAEEKAKELKTLNRSMFAVHVSNPFTAGSRRNARDQAVIDKHLEEKEQREQTRMQAYQTDQRMQQNFKKLNREQQHSEARQRNLAERAKYQFEADSDDEQMEDEIDGNLDALSGVTGRLHNLAKVTGEEVDRQNRLLDDISSQGDKVDLGLASNRAKIDRIH